MFAFNLSSEEGKVTNVVQHLKEVSDLSFFHSVVELKLFY
jgi:hypothetical protein